MEIKKKILILILGIVILGLGCFIGYLLFSDDKNNEEHVATGIVTYKTENTITVKAKDGMYYSVTNSNNDINVGDTVSVYTKDPVRETYPLGVTSSKIEILEQIKTNNQKDNNSNSNEPIPNNNASKSPVSGNTNDTSQSNSNTPKKTELDVIEYFTNLDSNLDQENKSDSLTKSIKNGFITIVDFLFYEGEIYGYKFNDLTNKAKLTIIKIALSIDNKIDKYFPGYKDTISTTVGRTYNNIKELLVKKYLEITTKICQNDPNTCKQAKSDFQDLKSSFGLTWNFITNLAKTKISNLSEWYKIWRNE